MTCACKHPWLRSYWWADYVGQNHRAEPGQAVCGGCGGGKDVGPVELARLEKEDREYEEKERKRNG